MSKYVIDLDTLTSIGDAVREKDGTTAAIPVDELASRILSIESSGGGAAAITLGQCSSQWFQVAATNNEEFWGLFPDGLDDVAALAIGGGDSGASNQVFCFPELDADYIIEKDGFTLYPIRFAGLLYGWTKYYPFNASNKKGYYLGIDKVNKLTKGFWTSDGGVNLSATGISTSNTYFFSVRKG